MKIQNPHDKIFKETFTKVEIAKDFLKNYLPSNLTNIIDLDSIRPEKDTFINEELEEYFSDILYSVSVNDNTGYIYFLFEHKSYQNNLIILQLLRYILEIWEAKMGKENSSKLPIVIPLVIFHGEKKWQIKRNLWEHIEGYELLTDDAKAYIPDYRYLLYDLTGYNNEEIKGEAILRILFILMRDIMLKSGQELLDSILRTIDYLNELEDKKKGVEYFEVFIKYVLGAGKDLDRKAVEEIIEKAESVYWEGSGIVMTFADLMREEGKKEELLNTISIQLKKKLKIAVLSEEMTNKLKVAKIEQLMEIRDHIFDIESINDVLRYLL